MAGLFVLKLASQWALQADEALDRIAVANGGELPEHIIDGDALDHEAFGSLIEALVALEPLTGRPVGQDLIDLAGLKPADQVILLLRFFMPVNLDGGHTAAYHLTGSTVWRGEEL